MKSINYNINDVELISGKAAGRLIGVNRLRRAVKAGWVKPAVVGRPYRAAEYVAADLIALVERIRKEGNPPLLPYEQAGLEKLARKKKEVGATLVEILGVVAIFVTFAAVASLTFSSVFGGSRKSIAEKNAATLNNAIEQYDQAGGLMTAEVPYQTVKPTDLGALAEARVFCKLSSTSSVKGGPFVAPYQSPVISRDPNDYRIIWVSGQITEANIIKGPTGLRSPAIERKLMVGDLVPGHFQVVGPGLYGPHPEDVPGIVSLTRGSGCTPVVGGGDWSTPITPPPTDGGGTTGNDGGDTGADSGFDGNDGGTASSDDGDSNEPEAEPEPTPTPGNDDGGVGDGGFVGGDGGGGAPDADEGGESPTPTPNPEPETEDVDPAIGYNVRIWSNLPDRGTTSSSSSVGGWQMSLGFDGAVLYWDRSKHPSVQELTAKGIFEPESSRRLTGLQIDRRQLTANLDIYVIWIESAWRENQPFSATIHHRPYWLSSAIWADLDAVVKNPAVFYIGEINFTFENLENHEGPVETVLEGAINPGANFNQYGTGAWWGPRSVTIYNGSAPEQLPWIGDDRGMETGSELIGTGTINVTYGVYVEASSKTIEVPYLTLNKPGAVNASYQIYATHKIFDNHQHWYGRQ